MMIEVVLRNRCPMSLGPVGRRLLQEGEGAMEFKKFKNADSVKAQGSDGGDSWPSVVEVF
jgi:hypothetical protein